MANLYAPPTQKTFAGKTAAQLINDAVIIKTKSNDYFIRIGDYNIDLTDDGDLCVSHGYGEAMCLMTIGSQTHDQLAAMHKTVEENYQKDNIGETK